MLQCLVAMFITASRHGWHSLRRRPSVPIEVLLASRWRHLVLVWDLQDAVLRLRHLLGTALPAELALVVQQTILVADVPLAGCHLVLPRPDGTRLTVIRLALEVGGQPQSTDQVLAALADQCFLLASTAVLLAGGVAPRDGASAQPSERDGLIVFPPNPFAPSRGVSGSSPAPRVG